MELSQSISSTSPSAKKTFADFSIEALLGRKEDRWGKVRNGCSSNSNQLPNNDHFQCHEHPTQLMARDATKLELEILSASDSPNSNADRESESGKATFDWLSCTRFKPPKLLRLRKKSCTKRNGRGPRIPFSTHQLAILEKTFVDSQYLSGDAITRLADNLHLTETRVKIWFQNRRARFRREKNSNSRKDFVFHANINDETKLSFESEHEKSSLLDGMRMKTPSNATKQSFRHLINDLNLMAASNANSTSIIHLQTHHVVSNSSFPLKFSGFTQFTDAKNLYSKDNNIASSFASHHPVR